jgi:hypothetical protein
MELHVCRFLATETGSGIIPDSGSGGGGCPSAALLADGSVVIVGSAIEADSFVDNKGGTVRVNDGERAVRIPADLLAIAAAQLNQEKK